MINWEWTEKDNQFLYELCEKIRDEIPFAFSRWGDGEWRNLTHDHPDFDEDEEFEAYLRGMESGEIEEFPFDEDY